MEKIKLIKSAFDAAEPQPKVVELRDTVVPGFLCKITRPAVVVHAPAPHERRRVPQARSEPIRELTVEQAYAIAQEWLVEVCRCGDLSAAESVACKERL